MKWWEPVVLTIVLASPLRAGQNTTKGKNVVITRSTAPVPFAAIPTLSVSPSTISFTASNPAGGPVSGSSPLTASITITSTSNNNIWTLTIQTLGSNLTSGSGGTIPVSSIQYTATGLLIAAGGKGSLTVNNPTGILSTGAVQTASGFEGNKTFQAQVQYSMSFTDSWNYDPDTYSQTVVLTLTAP